MRCFLTTLPQILPVIIEQKDLAAPSWVLCLVAVYPGYVPVYSHITCSVFSVSLMTPGEVCLMSPVLQMRSTEKAIQVVKQVSWISKQPIPPSLRSSS